MPDTVQLPDEVLKSDVQSLPADIVANRAKGDLGAGFSFDSSVASNLPQNLTFGPARSFTYWSYRTRSKMMVNSGQDTTDSDRWINKEQFDKEYSLGGSLHFENVLNGKMPRALAQQLMEDHVDDAFNASNVHGGKSEMAGAIVSSFLSPVDLAVNAVLPEYGVAKFGMGATVASRAGLRGTLLRTASRTINGAVNAELQNVATLPVMAAIAKYNQVPFTTEDVRQQLLAAPLMGAAGGFLHGVKAHFADDVAMRSFADAAFHASVSDRDPSVAKNLAAKDPKVQAIQGLSKRVKDLFSKKELNPVEQMEFDSMMAGPVPPDNIADAGNLWNALRDADPKEAGQIRRTILDEALKGDDGRVYEARTNDEKFLNEAWRSLFGVDLQYLDPKFADRLGVHGYVKGAEPGRAYIRSGDLFGGPESMLFLAGHELGHSIRIRDTAMWSDIVNSMMATAQDDGGTLARAWKLTVDRSKDKGVWAGMDMTRRMDETFSNVLGHAMTNANFWQQLHVRSPRSAEHLASVLNVVRNTLGDFLRKGTTDQLQRLYKDISTAIQRADENGLHLSQKIKPEDGSWIKTKKFYKTHEGLFTDMVNREGLKAEKSAVDFEAWYQTLFPQVSSFEDFSGSPGQTDRLTVVRKNIRIGSNPDLWMMKNLLAKAKPGSAEADLLKALGKIGLWNSSEKRTFFGTKAKKSTVSDLFAEHGLISFKQNADGTWDIGVFKNDDFNFPRWKEIFENLPDENSRMEDAIQSHLYEEIDQMRKDFSYAVRMHFDEMNSLHGYTFEKYINSLTTDEFAHTANESPNDLWVGYMEFLEAEAADARLANDWDAYRNLDEIIHQVDPLTHPGDTPRSNTRGDDSAVMKKKRISRDDSVKSWISVEKAWEELRAKYKEKASSLTDKQLEKENAFKFDDPTSVKEAVVADFKAARMEIEAEFRDLQNTHDNFVAFAEKEMAVKLAKSEKKFSDQLDAIFDKMAHDRVRNSGRWPQYDRVMKIVDATELAKREDLGIESMATIKSSELPEGYKDAHELFGLEDPMAQHDDLGDIYDDSFMAADPEEIASIKRMSLDQAEKLSYERLDKEHQVLAKWNTDTDKAQSASLKEMLERNDLADFVLVTDGEKPKAKEGEQPERSAASKNLLAQLNSVRTHLEIVARETARYASTGKLNTSGDGAVYSWAQHAADVFDYHYNRTGDRFEALNHSVADLRRESQAEAIRLIGNHEARQLLSKLAKEGLDTLYSRLDGSPRKGVKAAGNSISVAMEVRRQMDTAALMNAIVKGGFEDAWIMNDATLAKALISQINGSDMQDPAIKLVADTLKKVNEIQSARLNSKGANIRMLDGYVVPQVHNVNAIRANESEFLRDLMLWVDWDRVRKESNMAHDTSFDPELYAKQFLHEILESDKAKPDELKKLAERLWDGDMSSQYGRRRILHFKDTFAYDYDTKYGSGNFLGLITETLQKRSEAFVMVDHFGWDYKSNWNATMADIAQYHGNTPKFFNKMRRVDLTFQMLSGDLNHPDNVKTAAVGQAVRQYMNSVALWMSGVSSLTDIGNVTSALKWMGYDPKTMHKDLWKGIQEHFNKNTDDRNFLLSQGAGLNALLTAFSRTQAMDGPLYRMAQKASDFTFRWNGQELQGRILQYAVHDLMQQHLGEMTLKKEITPEFRNWLDFHGITGDEWSSMSKHATVVEGLPGNRLAPDMVTDPRLSAKLRVAMSNSVHHAILEPTVSDRAMLTLGTKAGTKAGEAVRCVMQYKGYPLAMIRTIQRRFSNAYGDTKAQFLGANLDRALIARAGWAASMITLAGTVLAIKDMARGREPFNPLDMEQWTIANASRLVTQAGVGPFAVAEQFLSPRQALGPAAGAAWDFGSNAVTANGYGVTNSIIGLAPGASFSPLREGSKAVLGSMFSESYGMHYQRFLQRLEREQGQTSIFLDKQAENN